MAALTRMAAVVALGVTLFGLGALGGALLGRALAATPEPLAFTVDADSYVVPDGDIVSVEQKEGLTFCLAPGAEKALSAFTASHTGETVAISIGETNVTHLKIVTPYDGGCINWPLHPKVAENYRRMLLGEEASAQ
ncbi:hypothetical protein [Acuticoccus sp. I52.16.1]|uniref:hypothetical protein n=1 Tax=Acuticoccus sp. I52.16.1 TaxID=2928472 RepID=UPI001FD3BEA5|nr:hypothetical protein [Acuticoccus sp. I52.16.1]UOM35446.1 hypothetical protein MRB58_04350 [Acuticoccus sp. I52.16.1]